MGGSATAVGAPGMQAVEAMGGKATQPRCMQPTFFSFLGLASFMPLATFVAFSLGMVAGGTEGVGVQGSGKGGGRRQGAF